MVDAMFAMLEARPDHGIGPFRAMLQSLLNWQHFDPYWFDNQGKLNRNAAQKSLDHMRQLQEIRDARIRDERKRRESADEQDHELLPHLTGLFGYERPQNAGYTRQHGAYQVEDSTLQFDLDTYKILTRFLRVERNLKKIRVLKQNDLNIKSKTKQIDFDSFINI